MYFDCLPLTFTGGHPSGHLQCGDWTVEPPGLYTLARTLGCRDEMQGMLWVGWNQILLTWNDCLMPPPKARRLIEWTRRVAAVWWPNKWRESSKQARLLLFASPSRGYFLINRGGEYIFRVFENSAICFFERPSCQEAVSGRTWRDRVFPSSPTIQGIDSDDGGRLTFGGRGLQGEQARFFWRWKRPSESSVSDHLINLSASGDGG